MRFKVDENLPIAVAGLLQAAGHDAATVNEEGIGGALDPDPRGPVEAREPRSSRWTLASGTFVSIHRTSTRGSLFFGCGARTGPSYWVSASVS